MLKIKSGESKSNFDSPPFAEFLLRLLTDTELFLRDDGAIAVDILTDKIVEKTTTLTYESLESAGGSVVFVVLLQVLGKMLDSY